MTAPELETLLLMLAKHHAVFAALCRDMGVQPDAIGRALVAMHREAVAEACEEMLPVVRDSV